MDAANAAVLLGVAASFDNRKPDPDAARAWAVALQGVTFEDAREAVINHYRTTHRWVMPADVLKGCAQIARNRAEALMVADVPRELAEMDDGHEHTAAYLAWVKSGGREVPQAQLTA